MATHHNFTHSTLLSETTDLIGRMPDQHMMLIGQTLFMEPLHGRSQICHATLALIVAQLVGIDHTFHMAIDSQLHIDQVQL